MTQASTLNSLVRLAYNELPFLERLETEFALTEDAEMLRDYEDLKASLRELPKVTFSPMQSTIDKVLRYSRNSRFEPTS